MPTRLGQLLIAPTFETEEKTRVSRLLNTVLWAFFGAVAVVFLAVVILTGLPSDSTEFVTLVSAAGALVITGLLMWLARRGHLKLVSIVFLSLLWLFITLWIASVAGIVSDTSLLAYPLIIVLAGLLLGGRAAVAFTIVSVLAVAGVFYLEVNGLLVVEERSLTIMDPLMAAIPLVLVGALLRYAMHSMNQALERARTNELAQVEANQELDAIRASLQDRVTERTQALEQRSVYLEAAAEVGRAATSILETERLIWRVAELLRERFGFYHVGIFLIDETGKWAEYRAGAGEGAQALREADFRLEVGGTSMVGWSAANARLRVAQNVDMEEARVDHLLVPETRSEATLPLIARGIVLGALSVQSDETEAFDQDALAALEGMADQVAVALDNARLFVQTEAALEAERRAYGETSREAWAGLVRDRPDWGYVCGQGGVVSPAQSDWQPAMIQAGEAGEIVQRDGIEIAVPVKVQDSVAGVIRLQKPDGALWTEDELVLVETLVEQLGLTLESARLYQDTQERAARDRLLGQVTARVRETLDVRTVLDTAAREIGETLGLAAVDVRLGTQPGASEQEQEPVQG